MIRRKKTTSSQRGLQRQRRSYSTLLGHRVAHHGPSHQAPLAVSGINHSDTQVIPQPNGEELQRQTELERELQLARDIQQGLLLAAVPHLPGWELSAVSMPARDLGGDLYDFLPIGSGWQGIMIGDVAGKGLPAALQMAVARTVFRHAARDGQSSAITLAAVNQGILSEIPQGMVTMLYALLDPARGVLRIANAGHTFPLLVNGSVQELEISGLPLGIDLDTDYEEITIVLEPGDMVVFYTDGIIEAFNEKCELFGLDRLQQLLANHSHLKPRALMTLLLHELRAWGSSNAQSDDVTIVVVRRRLARLHDEIRSIVDDVLGAERAAGFWVDTIASLCEALLLDATSDEWSEMLPSIVRATQACFGRGLARELNQHLRLAIEEYRK